MPPVLEKPVVPPGSHRDFIDKIHDLYDEAYRPTVREIEDEIVNLRAKKNPRIRGTASRETIRKLLNAENRKSSPKTVETVVLGLCSLAGIDPDEVDVTAIPVPRRAGPLTRVKVIVDAWIRQCDDYRDDRRATEFPKPLAALESGPALGEPESTDFFEELRADLLGSRTSDPPRRPLPQPLVFGRLEAPPVAPAPKDQQYWTPPPIGGADYSHAYQGNLGNGSAGVPISLPTTKQLPEGPRRDQVTALHELHVRAGCPGTWYMAYTTEHVAGLAVSDAKISALFRGDGILDSPEELTAVIKVLAPLTTPPSNVEPLLTIFGLGTFAELAPSIIAKFEEAARLKESVDT